MYKHEDTFNSTATFRLNKCNMVLEVAYQGRVGYASRAAGAIK